MLKRFFRLLFILFCVSLISFWICSHTNINPVEQWCISQKEDFEGFDCIYSEQSVLKRKEWGLDLPLFYVEISTWAEPDTLYKIADKKVKQCLVLLLQKGNTWQNVQSYHKNLYLLQQEHSKIKDSFQNDSSFIEYDKANMAVKDLFYETERAEIAHNIQVIQSFYQKYKHSSPTLLQIAAQSAQIRDYQFNIKNYLPTIHFYGSQNQYHQWLVKVLQGDFGKSYRTNQPIAERIGDFVGRSSMFALLSFVLALIISIPLGTFMAVYQHSFFDKITEAFIFIINSLPTFIIGIFLIIFFANPNIFNWFLPSYNYQGTWIERATLPLITYTIGGICFYSIFIKSLLIRELGQDYIRTAKAKGLKEWSIYFKHALKNILVPLATASAGLLPSLIGGSVAIEYIFSIGGMGEEAMTAIQNLDIPMVLAIMTITAFLTVVGYMISDVFSYFIDKRIWKS